MLKWSDKSRVCAVMVRTTVPKPGVSFLISFIVSLYACFGAHAIPKACRSRAGVVVGLGPTGGMMNAMMSWFVGMLPGGAVAVKAIVAL